MKCGASVIYNNLFTCDCSVNEYMNFPDIKVQIDSSIYTITKENYIARSAGKCVFKIMHLKFGAAIERRFWIMGLTFFHNYYVAFDVENSRIGFSVSNLVLANQLQHV